MDNLYRIGSATINTNDPVESWKFSPKDVVQALRGIRRFLGKSNWSVWDHSLLVAWMVENDGGSKSEILAALFHDASEAFISDIPGPIKPLLGNDLRTFEGRLNQEILRRAFRKVFGRRLCGSSNFGRYGWVRSDDRGWVFLDTAKIKRADKGAVAIEHGFWPSSFVLPESFTKDLYYRFYQQ